MTARNESPMIDTCELPLNRQQEVFRETQDKQRFANYGSVADCCRWANGFLGLARQSHEALGWIVISAPALPCGTQIMQMISQEPR
jgi:hypothetical protein